MLEDLLEIYILCLLDNTGIVSTGVSSTAVVTSTTSKPMSQLQQHGVVSNFSLGLGESSLFPFGDLSFRDQTQLTTVSRSPEEVLETKDDANDNPPTLEESDDKSSRVVRIRTSRRSLSYDIIFKSAQRSHSSLQSKSECESESRESSRDPPEISIRIRTGESRRVKASGRESWSKKQPDFVPGPGQVSIVKKEESQSLSSTEKEDYLQSLEQTVSTLKNINAELGEEVKTLKEKLEKAQTTIGLLEMEVVANLYGSADTDQ